MVARCTSRSTAARVSLAIAAAQYGRRVYYSTLSDMVASLEEAQAAGTLKRRLAVLTHPSLLVVDEIGYLPVTQSGAVLFFQLMGRRYERASTVLTSNKGFEEWGQGLGKHSVYWCGAAGHTRIGMLRDEGWEDSGGVRTAVRRRAGAR